MGACSPCNILFHVLSLLQAGGVEGARGPGGGRCTNVERDLLAPSCGAARRPAPAGLLHQLVRVLSCPPYLPLCVTVHAVLPHMPHPCVSPTPPPPTPLFSAQVALAITICIIVGVKLQDVSYDSGNFNYSCLLGTDYGSSSLCTVSERDCQCRGTVVLAFRVAAYVGSASQ